MPSGCSLSSGPAISFSDDSWRETGDQTGRDGNTDGIDFDDDGNTLEAAAIISKARTGNATPQQIDATRSAAPVSVGQPAGAVTASATAQPIAAAGPAARPAQASRPGRSGNIDQQQSSNVFDQLTAEAVITSVALVPAIALPSLASAADSSTPTGLQNSDIRTLPEDEAPQSRDQRGVHRKLIVS